MQKISAEGIVDNMLITIIKICLPEIIKSNFIAEKVFYRRFYGGFGHLNYLVNLYLKIK